MSKSVETSWVIGNVRVQPLGRYLVRIEQRGAAGFEDRETFTVQNREWSCTSGDPDYYIFHFSGTLPAGGQSSFGFKARFIPGNTRGKCTVTSQIVSGSGGENRETNNSDSEAINYFAK